MSKGNEIHHVLVDTFVANSIGRNVLKSFTLFKTLDMTPEDYRFQRATPQSIRGVNTRANAPIVRDILDRGQEQKEQKKPLPDH